VLRSHLLPLSSFLFPLPSFLFSLSASLVLMITFVCVGPEGRPVPVPDQWRRLFPRWEEDAA